MRLSLSVTFSAVVGYVLAASDVAWTDILLLVLGGYGMVGASNGFNQVWERNSDRKMKRTQGRPLASGRLSVAGGLLICFALTAMGSYVLWLFNTETMLLGLASIVMYVLMYTPLKTVSPISVFVGAFPGGIPILIGCIAATGEMNSTAGYLFLMQFMWQFPHFWIIAWIAHKDYTRAGLKMLPFGKPDRNTSFTILLYTATLLPISLLPITRFSPEINISAWATILSFVLGIFLMLVGIAFHRKQDKASCRRFNIILILYLPLVQLIYMIDKWVS